MTARRTNKPARWWRVTGDAPSPQVLRWVRRTILGLWALVLVIGVPSYINTGRVILERPPSAERDAELREHIAASLFVLVGAPLMALAVFGYGVLPRKNAGIDGGPLFQTLELPSDGPGDSKGTDHRKAKDL